MIPSIFCNYRLWMNFLVSKFLLYQLICLGLVSSIKLNHDKDEIIVEVPFGKTAILKCRSNDENHNFRFWLVATNEVVGPGSEFNELKFNYEVLSGNLTIRAVSLDEQGTYNCVSQGVKNNDINVRSVRMVVKKDWEEVYEDDPSVNFFRVILALGTVAMIAGGLYLAYRIRKNRLRHPSYLEQSDEDDDSAEELFRAPGTQPSTSRETERPPVKSTNIVLDGFKADFDTHTMSTDFGSILDQHKL